MSPRLAFVFPGQGSQSVGMVAELAEHFSLVRATFAEASAAVGTDLWQLVQDGPAEDLNRTEHTQPALVAASVAIWRLWRQQGGAAPVFLAGHSLGEYSALVCAGVLSLTDAASLVAERGRLMQEAVPEGVGAMAAVIGASDEQVAQVCAEAAGDEVVAPANYNCPGQVVIAGHAAAVDRALAKLAELGARKAVKLAVSVPSHTALMRAAADKLAERMERIHWCVPGIPVVQNATAAVGTDLGAIREALKQQLYSPVRWSECMAALRRFGVTDVAECGPGKVLTGLTKRIDRSLVGLPLGTPDGVAAALTHWSRDQREA